MNLELAGLIVKLNLANPLEIDPNFYKLHLQKTFNHDYTIEQINESLNILCIPEPEELTVYPDDHIEGV